MMFPAMPRPAAPVLAALIAALAAPALAQTRPAAPAPVQAPTPGAPASPTSGPTTVALKPEPSNPDWVKVCGKEPGSANEICYTTRDFVSDQGQPVLAIAVYDVKQNNQKFARFILPLGLLLKPGIKYGVDAGKAEAGQFAICLPNGCFAEGQTQDAFIGQMKKGTTLKLTFQNQVGSEVNFQVPLAGFGKAFDGAPVDPKVLEEQQRKLQEELQKRSEELRQKLGSGTASSETETPAAAAPGAAPAAPAKK